MNGYDGHYAYMVHTLIIGGGRSMKEKIVKLIDVKSIMTLALTGGFIGLTCAGEITGDQFLTIFTMIVGFYFGTQSQK